MVKFADTSQTKVDMVENSLKMLLSCQRDVRFKLHYFFLAILPVLCWPLIFITIFRLVNPLQKSYSQCCTLSMLYTLSVVRSQCCILSVLYALSVVCSQCCMLSMLYALSVVCSQCCMLSVLYAPSVVCSQCCMLSVLYALSVVCSQCCMLSV